MLRHELVLGI